MANYRLTNKAVEDLNSIWEYTFNKWSQAQADKYYNLLLSRCEEIAKNPNIGRIYDTITDELYGLKSDKHIIFYRISVFKSIEITRILHQKMDLKNRMLE